MFGIFKSKKEKISESTMNVVIALEGHLLLFINYVREDMYKDFFLVSYALFDKAFSYVHIEDKQFNELFSITIADIYKIEKINKPIYNKAFEDFIRDYIDTVFERLTDDEETLIAMGSDLAVGNQFAAMGLSAYFKKGGF